MPKFLDMAPVAWRKCGSENGQQHQAPGCEAFLARETRPGLTHRPALGDQFVQHQKEVRVIFRNGPPEGWRLAQPTPAPCPTFPPRATAAWGERSTVPVAAQRAARAMLELGALREDPGHRGRFLPHPLPAGDAARRLLHTAAATLDLTGRGGSPGLFPFTGA